MLRNLSTHLNQPPNWFLWLICNKKSVCLPVALAHMVITFGTVIQSSKTIKTFLNYGWQSASPWCSCTYYTLFCVVVTALFWTTMKCYVDNSHNVRIKYWLMVFTMNMKIKMVHKKKPIVILPDRQSRVHLFIFVYHPSISFVVTAWDIMYSPQFG